MSQTSRLRPPPTSALAGSSAARRLLREPPERLGRLDVVGPAGTGKSVLLDALADVMERAGRTVLRDLPADATPVDPQVALLVDDAHLLTPEDLARLAALAEGDVGVLVVAHRPWPRPDGMSALGAALAIRRAPVVLGALDRPGVQARAAHVLGRAGTAATGRRRRPRSRPDRRPPRARRPDARHPGRAGRPGPDALALGPGPSARRPVGPAGLRRPPSARRRARPPPRPRPRRPAGARPAHPRAGPGRRRRPRRARRAGRGGSCRGSAHRRGHADPARVGRRAGAHPTRDPPRDPPRAGRTRARTRRQRPRRRPPSSRHRRVRRPGGLRLHRGG